MKENFDNKALKIALTQNKDRHRNVYKFPPESDRPYVIEPAFCFQRKCKHRRKLSTHTEKDNAFDYGCAHLSVIHTLTLNLYTLCNYQKEYDTWKLLNGDNNDGHD